MRKLRVVELLSLLLILSLVACANPADNAPAAEVSEPAAEPAPAPAEESGTAYTFSNEGSSVSWVGSKVTGAHDGGFNAFTGSFTVDGDDVTAGSVEVNIDTTSLWSDNDDLTGHLKSPDFFDVEQFPTSTFTSTGIAAAEGEEGGYTVTGNLNLHGVTKQISFPATIAMADGGFTAQAEFSIMRFDFGMEYPGPADNLIRDEVVIKFDLNGSAGGDAPADAAADAPTETASDDAQAH